MHIFCVYSKQLKIGYVMYGSIFCSVVLFIRVYKYENFRDTSYA